MAPKKEQGRGTQGVGGFKPPPKQTPSSTDGDHIIFTNSKNDTQTSSSGSRGSKGKALENGNPPDSAEQPRRPDTRTLIGGASWTGKLPVNLLAEHCQKQRWERPEYTMSKTPEGYSSMVILKQTNPKTKELMTLPPFKLPPTHKHLATQPTALEARHFAATYALFRVCSMRNIHMMLPPTYRDLWKGEFVLLKKEDVKEGRGWMYEADPFTAKEEREESKIKMAKKREERDPQKAKDSERIVNLGSAATTIGGNNIWRGWQRAPRVEMGNKTRKKVEGLIHKRAIWNHYGIEIGKSQHTAIVDELAGLGFRRSHVQEAVSQCKDREEVLEWLLIHVPEDDLPSWSFPEGYAAGVSLATSDLVKEAKIKRLAAAGYSTDVCQRALDDHRGDERLAAEMLQMTLLSNQEGRELDTSNSTDDGQWLEEQSALEAIFEQRYSLLSGIICQITADENVLSRPVTFQFQKPTRSYPANPPILSVFSQGLPAYIRLSVIRQAIQHCELDLLGESMIFSLVDWLEGNLSKIVESPGKLRDISTDISSVSVSSEKKRMMHRGGLPRQPKELDWRPGSQESLRLKASWTKMHSSQPQQKMMVTRKLLPAWPVRDQIVSAVAQHQVTIISGETGSGKSTQSVQFILDDMIQRDLASVANIICTQPRRISALGLADRVSEERCSKVGEEVGYIIRGDSRVRSGTTKITFVTTGVLLRRMQSFQDQANGLAASLADVTHVVVDEVHERSLDADFLLALLQDVLKHRRDLKVILMSATLDAELFRQYFGGEKEVGKVEIPGRTFPVQDLYIDDVIRETGFGTFSTRADEDEQPDLSSDIEDLSINRTVRSVGMGTNYDLIACVVRHIDSQLKDQSEGILIFLPGTMEIDRCLGAVRSIANIHPLPLHASLLPAEQRRVFQPSPRGKRKVIAATNVAETSITIEDVVAVIDTGRVKETSYDPKDNMVRLEEVWASQAACKQRRGRAGRVRAGICYKLYTRNAESNMAARPEPEIRRVPLEQLCLTVKAMGGIQDVVSFLNGTLTPPDSIAIEGALGLLHRIGALDSDHLTALGRHLAMIPADLRCAKLMVYGSIFGCVEACLTIAAILTVRSPFVSPRDKRDEARTARNLFSKGDGDLLIDLEAYRQWATMTKSASYREIQAWCSTNFLSHQTLRDISSNKAQFVSSLKDRGFFPIDYDNSHDAIQEHWNRHDHSTQLIRALVAAAFTPQAARIEFPDKKFAASISGAVELDPEARKIKYFNQENGRVFVHPSSALFDAQSYSGSAAYLSYFTKMATSKVFIRDLTPFNVYGLLLFSGPITLDTLGRGLVVDGWLRLRGWARIGVMVSRLRIMLDEVLARRIDDPGLDMEEDEVVGVVRRLVELNGLDQ